MLNSRLDTTQEKISKPKDSSKKLSVSNNRWRVKQIMVCPHTKSCLAIEENELKSNMQQKRKQAQRIQAVWFHSLKILEKADLIYIEERRSVGA